MKLTKTAQELQDMGGFQEYGELTQAQEELSECMGSDSFGYALFDSGRLKPKDWVEGEDLKKLEEAIELVDKFKRLVENLHSEF